jgi:hypothetical protein
MSAAIARRSKAISLIKEGKIGSQSDLVRELKRAGFSVTQTTASRDLEEIGAVRIRGANGEALYSIAASQEGSLARSMPLPSELIISIESSGNLADQLPLKLPDAKNIDLKPKGYAFSCGNWNHYLYLRPYSVDWTLYWQCNIYHYCRDTIHLYRNNRIHYLRALCAGRELFIGPSYYETHSLIAWSGNNYRGFNWNITLRVSRWTLGSANRSIDNSYPGRSCFPAF